jgi:intein/homing endonuclease
MKRIKIPNKITEELAELVGIMYGDGCMTNKHNYTYRISIFCNKKKDREHAFYIKKIFVNNFDIIPKETINDKKSDLTLYVLSKSLTIYFNKILQIPYSPKILTNIPSYIKEHQPYLKAFLRGLFDTDGCVTYQRDKGYIYPLVKIITKHKLFAQDIKESLINLGIKAFICRKKDKKGNLGYDIVVRNKRCIKFFEIIGSNNPRNIKKWGCWEIR